MVKEKYIPGRGDIVWLNFDPQIGREQSGHRPALIISTRFYNRRGLALVCPITSKSKGYPYEIPFKAGEIEGSILADHVKNQDWQNRNAKFITKINKSDLDNVYEMISGIMLEEE